MDADRLYRRQSFDIFNFIIGTLCVLNCLPLGSVRAILEDGRDKAVEAGCVIAGGHTIQDDEPRYCLCVTGFVHPRHILKNVGTRWTRLDLAADPQTSGGLLVSLPRENAEELLEKLHTFAPWSAIVGEVLPQDEATLEFD